MSAALAYGIVYTAGLFLAGVIRHHYAAPHFPRPASASGETPTDKTPLTLSGLATILPLVTVFAPVLRFAAWRPPTWAACAGAVVYAGAIALFTKCHADLAYNWSPRIEIAERQTLVTHGVYSRVRHPMYTSLVLWAVAQLLLVWNWITGPLFLAALIPFLLVRIPREEAMMAERFGDEYRAYMKRTGRLLPRLLGATGTAA